ncbi:lactoylglutathione lyase [Parvibaculum indicum]|uniref:VOC family protein n=1 Tax=Parvibaculum indicum TaxID=562969 RepID=UPI00142212F0|nr:VOC family protein [Parvibaculum indicum]NIJ40550.1 lactoylglutathione lyase [Parvibaculum indicum]
MHLAKPRIDVGLFTNDLEPMLAFWQNKVGLKLDHVLPLGGGKRQHRHDLAGSVLKINHARDPLPDARASGYRELLIAREGVTEPEALTDPDGNRVTLVPEGWLGMTRIGIRLGVRDLAAHRDFYGRVLELEEIPAETGIAFRCGDSMILAEEDPDAPADAAMDGPGWRYVTVQVFKVDEEHAAILARGGAEGMAPRTLGETARISFIRDPDGNWIEMSQRASLTGSLD